MSFFGRRRVVNRSIYTRVSSLPCQVMAGSCISDGSTKRGSRRIWRNVEVEQPLRCERGWTHGDALPTGPGRPESVFKVCRRSWLFPCGAK